MTRRGEGEKRGLVIWRGGCGWRWRRRGRLARLVGMWRCYGMPKGRRRAIRRVFGRGCGNGLFDLFGPNLWQRYEHGVLIQEAANVLGMVPFVRYENAGDPAAGTKAGP